MSYYRRAAHNYPLVRTYAKRDFASRQSLILDGRLISKVSITISMQLSHQRDGGLREARGENQKYGDRSAVSFSRRCQFHNSVSRTREVPRAA